MKAAIEFTGCIFLIVFVLSGAAAFGMLLTEAMYMLHDYVREAM